MRLPQQTRPFCSVARICWDHAAIVFADDYGLLRLDWWSWIGWGSE